mgnify:CR=1 FL=1
MAHTVTILADHKGFARPRVVGDEYMVDVSVNITNYVAGGVTVTAASCGLESITQVVVTGQEGLDNVPIVMVEDTGEYFSSSSFKLALNQGLVEQAGTGDEGLVRLRVCSPLPKRMNPSSKD